MRMLLAACATLCWSGAAHAQAIRGTAVDATTGAPVEATQVTVALGARQIAQVLTDSLGRFRVTVPGAGTYRLAASALGYVTVERAELDVKAGERVEVTLRLATTALPLEPLNVTARRADPRHDATYEGFYTRREILPPIGNRRAVHRDDPEMMNAQRIEEVLKWFPPVPRCVVHYMNGHELQNAKVVEFMLDLPMVEYEGVEFYRHRVDAPLEMQGPGNDCSIIAVWLRRPEHLSRFRPPILGILPHGRIELGGGPAAVHGTHAPGVGRVFELSAQWEWRRSTTLGLHARTSTHTLGASATDALTDSLPPIYGQPPGARTLRISTLGLEARLTLDQRGGLRPVLTGRVQAANRTFTLPHSVFVQGGTVRVNSAGWGVGAGARLERDIGSRFVAHVAFNTDLIWFQEYDQIEREWNRTAAKWLVSSLRLGIDSAF